MIGQCNWPIKRTISHVHLNDAILSWMFISLYLDYAVEIFHHALKFGKYNCYLRPDTRMPMIYLPDVIRATVDILKCPNDWLSVRTYNITAMSFTPEEVANEIRKYIPNLEMTYAPDQLRQNIGKCTIV